MGTAHAASLLAEIDAYLAAVVAFDEEGLSPFPAARARAALNRELPPGHLVRASRLDLDRSSTADADSYASRVMVAGNAE